MAKKKVKKKKAASKAKPQLSFEEAFERLRQIVAELEHGDLSLTESLEKYQQGVAGLQQCHASLESAQQKIELLVDLDDDGNVLGQPFDTSASAGTTDNVRRSTNMPREFTDSKNDPVSEIEGFEPDEPEDSLF